MTANHPSSRHGPIPFPPIMPGQRRSPRRSRATLISRPGWGQEGRAGRDGASGWLSGGLVSGGLGSRWVASGGLVLDGLVSGGLGVEGLGVRWVG
ncbi:hypothetical protein GCM10009850_017620 [Nonomuraea monospora]|uniref:Uncharacterized protein n=1 Tax=Nonomuraea monospora TaxID=568818 RepID=A0ABN3CAQ1_9ACTN